MFERFRKLIGAAPTSGNLSRLEFLFATPKGPPDVRKLIQDRKDNYTPVAMNVSVAILGYAGHHAARTCRAIQTLPSNPKLKQFADTHCQIRGEFDSIFIETAALCFHTVMHRFWDKDCLEYLPLDPSDDDADAATDYFESFMEALDFADDIVSDISPKIPKGYLYLRAREYDEEPDETYRVDERFATHILEQIFPETDYVAVPGTPLLCALFMMAAEDIDPTKLKDLCQLTFFGDV